VVEFAGLRIVRIGFGLNQTVPAVGYFLRVPRFDLVADAAGAEIGILEHIDGDRGVHRAGRAGGIGHRETVSCGADFAGLVGRGFVRGQGSMIFRGETGDDATDGAFLGGGGGGREQERKDEQERQRGFHGFSSGLGVGSAETGECGKDCRTEEWELGGRSQLPCSGYENIVAGAVSSCWGGNVYTSHSSQRRA
jgi:hypothetical protein